MKIIQISATPNPNGVYQVFGLSEDGKVYVWSKHNWEIYDNRP